MRNKIFPLNTANKITISYTPKKTYLIRYCVESMEKNFSIETNPIAINTQKTGDYESNTESLNEKKRNAI